MEVDNDVDGEGGVARAGVGPRRSQGRLRPGGGRIRSPDRRVERLLVLAHRAPGRAHGTAVEGGNGVQGLGTGSSVNFRLCSDVQIQYLRPFGNAQ